MNNIKPSYSLKAKIFHWGFVVFFVYGISKSVDDLNQLEDSSLLKFEVLFALTFLFILAGRFFYMKKNQKTSLPMNTPKMQRLAAKLVHLLMYVGLGVIAVTGLMIGLIFWVGFKDGFLIEVVITIHELAIPLIYWLITIHVAAAIYHRLLNDGVWNSMVPFWKEK
jgi:cytochrome b561